MRQVQVRAPRLAMWIAIALGGALLAGCDAQLSGGAVGADLGRIGDGPAQVGDGALPGDSGPVIDGQTPSDAGVTPDVAGTPDQGAPDSGTVIVGNPGLFTQSVFEMDFSQGTNGRYRANGGAWQDFNSWNQAGSNGGWSNAGVYVQTTDAVRTELVTNALGPGKVLRTWIEAGDTWKSGANYPRTELTSSYTGDIPFKSEWRLELPFYGTGDVATAKNSIIGFQLHHNGNTGSPPFGLHIDNGMLTFGIEESPSGPNTFTDIVAMQPNTRYDLVMELKFGYVADGAYVKLWVDGVQYVDITDRNVGYPDLESTAGYWKFCSLYDWGNYVQGSRSIYSGPVVKLLKRP